MRIYTIMLSAMLTLSLIACVPKNGKPDVGTTTAKIDPSMLVSCPALPVPDPSVIWDLGKAVQAYTDLQGVYTECAVRNDCLINAVKDPSKTTSCPSGDVKKP